MEMRCERHQSQYLTSTLSVVYTNLLVKCIGSQHRLCYCIPCWPQGEVCNFLSPCAANPLWPKLTIFSSSDTNCHLNGPLTSIRQFTTCSCPSAGVQPQRGAQAGSPAERSCSSRASGGQLAEASCKAQVTARTGIADLCSAGEEAMLAFIALEGQPCSCVGSLLSYCHRLVCAWSTQQEQQHCWL